MCRVIAPLLRSARKIQSNIAHRLRTCAAAEPGGAHLICAVMDERRCAGLKGGRGGGLRAGGPRRCACPRISVPNYRNVPWRSTAGDDGARLTRLETRSTAPRVLRRSQEVLMHMIIISLHPLWACCASSRRSITQPTHQTYLLLSPPPASIFLLVATIECWGEWCMCRVWLWRAVSTFIDESVNFLCAQWKSDFKRQARAAAWFVTSQAVWKPILVQYWRYTRVMWEREASSAQTCIYVQLVKWKTFTYLYILRVFMKGNE